ncbi:DedA family protein [Nocardia exalbida]|uniref:DedA family protein n=1 Tax=Nocardia exalbida TaxID=290231 RepID=UPI0002F9116A|nr:DedA family protein [Nocardia exalbida]
MFDITTALDGVHGLALYAAIAALTISLFWIPMGLIIPGEPLFVLVGILAAGNRVDFQIVLAVVIASNVVGPTGTYYLGRVFDDWIRHRPVDSKLRRALEKGESSLRKRGTVATLFACWIPLLRTTIPVLIGASKYSFPRFLAFSATGTTIWSAIFVSGGFFAGPFFEKFATYAGMVLLAALVCFLLVKLVRRLTRRAVPAEPNQLNAH